MGQQRGGGRVADAHFAEADDIAAVGRQIAADFGAAGDGLAIRFDDLAGTVSAGLSSRIHLRLPEQPGQAQVGQAGAIPEIRFLVAVGGQAGDQAGPKQPMGDRKPMAAQGHPGVKQAAPEKGDGGDEGGDDKGDEKKENTAWGRMLNKLNERKGKRAEQVDTAPDGWVPLLR